MLSVLRIDQRDLGSDTIFLLYLLDNWLTAAEVDMETLQGDFVLVNNHGLENIELYFLEPGLQLT